MAGDGNRGPRLAGKVAIVTGAGSVGEGFGTGKATAALFAREGAAVVLADVVPERAEATRDLILAEGGRAIVVACDVTRDEDCARTVAAAVTAFGRLDVLDNNVGLATTGTILDLAPEDWARTMAVNLTGPVNMTRHAVAPMRDAGGGSVINIGSISPWRPNKATAYSVSKGALEALSRALAVDLGPFGIRVNTIAPGPLNTPRAVARQTEEQRAMRRRTSPLDREGSGWDIGWAAVYLASEEARYVTGTVLTVDGGVSIRGHAYR